MTDRPWARATVSHLNCSQLLTDARKHDPRPTSTNCQTIHFLIALTRPTDRKKQAPSGSRQHNLRYPQSGARPTALSSAIRITQPSFARLPDVFPARRCVFCSTFGVTCLSFACPTDGQDESATISEGDPVHSAISSRMNNEWPLRAALTDRLILAWRTDLRTTDRPSHDRHSPALPTLQ